MSAEEHTSGLTKRVLRWCTVLTLVYLLTVFTLPFSETTIDSYHIDSLQYRIAVIMVNIPFIAVWFFAFWGYAKLKQYAFAIKQTKEGKHFDKLADGLSWLAWSLPLTAIVSRVLSGIERGELMRHPTEDIINNYVSLILPFVAFLIIGASARGMIGPKRQVSLKSSSGQATALLFGLAGIIYCYLVLSSFDLSSLSSTSNHYHLPALLMIITVMIPYLYAWITGLLAAYEITIYAKNVKGLLYKKALTNLASGLFALVLSFIASQYLSNVWPSPGHLVFNSRLIIITAIRIIGGISFVLMALGANQLKRIEEI
jgi:cytochrome bd-type quinol oxidase subunit 2